MALLRSMAGNKCKVCGYDKEPSILHFHHRNPEEKLFKLCTVRSMEDSIKEMKKTDLLCPNCHALHHLKKDRTKYFDV